jgi:hypothetical protein
MKRWLALLLLLGAASPLACAAPTDEPRLVIRLDEGVGHAVVRLSHAAIRRHWPTWRGEPIDVATVDDRDPHVAIVRGADALTIHAHSRSTVVLTRASSDEQESHPVPPFVGGIEREMLLVRGDRVFGAVASADPRIYDPPGERLAGHYDHWFLAGVAPGKSVSIPIDLTRVERGSTVGVAITSTPTHRGETVLEVTLGGTTAAPAGRTEFGALRFDVPLDAPAASVPLVVRNATRAVEHSGDPNDVSDDVGTAWIEWIEVRATMRGDGVSRVLVGTSDAAETTIAQRVIEVDGDSRLRAWPSPREPVPTLDETDWLAIAAPSLLEPARRLGSHRARTGLRAKVVATTDLAPDGDGEGLANAIRRLVTAATGKTTGPRYLLLVGDADRDRGPAGTIPTTYSRTLYNGATACDRAYGEGADGKPLAIVGRLPFSDPKALDAYVDRVIAAETRPPVDDTRRTVRFIASEGRFGAEIDGMIEHLFKQVVATQIPHSYEASVTFATPSSAFGWPAPEFNDKVIGDLNAGSLFFTYVGHGWWNGFDHLRVDGKRYPILNDEHARRVAVTGTSPAMFVIACTTAQFDDPATRSIGERLLDQPRGPIAYWGATRVCHPAWNSIVGRQVAIEMFPREPGRDGAFRDPSARRLGDVIEAATQVAQGPPPSGDAFRRVIEMGASRMIGNPHVDLARLKREGATMYVLLGDPAVRLPFPKHDIAVTSQRTDTGVTVTATGPFPDGADVVLEVDVARDAMLPFERDPSWSPEETMRRRNAASNEKTLATATVKASGGKATAALAVRETRRNDSLFAIARWTGGDDVHVGSAPVPKPE